MKWTVTLLLIFACFVSLASSFTKKPTVLISINSRNDQHLLSTFLAYLERLDYPKKRISIMIQTDHNEDDTFSILTTWTSNVRHMYHRVMLLHDEEPIVYPDANGPNHFTEQRYLRLLQLRQNALQEARNQWADYILFIDTDNFIEDTELLQHLMKEKKTVIAPLLKVKEPKESLYSNFWGGVDKNGYYVRTESYTSILTEKTKGTFRVPMIHSTYLIYLRDSHTDDIQFSPIPAAYKGAVDDLLVFSFVIQRISKLKLYICNKYNFGFMLPPSDSKKTIKQRQMQFTNTFLQKIARTHGEEILRSENAPHKFPRPSYAEFDEIFVINLKRREERYQHMKNTLRELALKWNSFEAVEGRSLSKEKLDDLGIKPLSNFKDRFFERPITKGEVGCFLSHFYVWQEMVERNLEMVLILEDDVKFAPNFRQKLSDIFKVVNSLGVKPVSDWDLLYLGRKPLSKSESFVGESNKKLVFPKFSYWMIGYVLRLSGAKKLLAGDPLSKIVPVDDYVSIKYGKHEDKVLMNQFKSRDLIAISATDLLVEPTHFPEQKGYYSDADNSDFTDGRPREEYAGLKVENEHTTSKSTRTDL